MCRDNHILFYQPLALTKLQKNEKIKLVFWFTWNLLFLHFVSEWSQCSIIHIIPLCSGKPTQRPTVLSAANQPQADNKSSSLQSNLNNDFHQKSQPTGHVVPSQSLVHPEESRGVDFFLNLYRTYHFIIFILPAVKSNNPYSVLKNVMLVFCLVIEFTFRINLLQ